MNRKNTKTTGSRALLAAGLLAGLTMPAAAHHGQDFLLLQDATVPLPLHGNAMIGGDWARFGSHNAYAIEPGVLFGVAPRVALGTTAEFLEGGNGWRYSSVSPYAQIALTPADWRVRVSLQAGYSFVEREDPGYTEIEIVTREPVTTTKVRRVTVSSEPAKEAHAHALEPAETVPDAASGATAEKAALDKNGKPPERQEKARHAGHSHESESTRTERSTEHGHNERVERKRVRVEQPEYRGLYPEEDHFFSRLVIEADITKSDRFVFNLLCVSPDRSHTAWGYAAGWRHSFHHDFAAGVEAIGDFGDADEHEILAGAYWTPVHPVTLKLGVGAGLTDATPDFTVRTGLVWRF